MTEFIMGIEVITMEELRARLIERDAPMETGLIEDFRIIETPVSEMQAAKKPSKPYYRKNQRW